MDLTPLNAISPIDGRYRSQVTELSGYFSEHALIRYRLFVEVEYFIALCKLPLDQLREVDESYFEKLRQICADCNEHEAEKIKALELVTNHDVKAVEYYLKKKFDELGLGNFREFIHFGLTSQDINNTAIPASLRDAITRVIVPKMDDMVSIMISHSHRWKDIPMLARTHGQAASPTRLGKEIYVFVDRLQEQVIQLEQIHIRAKFGGATGNFNAHHAAYPQIDWVTFANSFVEGSLGLTRSSYTTQIEHYDSMASMFDVLKRVNTILIDLCRDMWTYISMDYFRQKIREDEVGSSAMPHKVNPIDFENAEGNLGLANAMFEHLSSKLPVSRLQRDLTDSTVLRNIGVPIAHTYIALNSVIKGLEKLELNEKKINSELEANWAVVAEGIQTILRREGYPQPYEALKSFTRGKSEINREVMNEFIDSLDVTDDTRRELRALTPFNYTGIDLLDAEFEQ